MSPGASFEELKAWVLARLLWNPSSESAENLIAEFISVYYGPNAATFVTNFLNELEQTARTTGKRIGLNPNPSAPYLSPSFVLKAEEELTSAVIAAGNDKDRANRCERLLYGVWYVMLFRFEEMRKYALGHQPPLKWRWGANATGALYSAFANGCTRAQITHLSEDGHDLFWLRRQIFKDIGKKVESNFDCDNLRIKARLGSDMYHRFVIQLNGTNSSLVTLQYIAERIVSHVADIDLRNEFCSPIHISCQSCIRVTTPTHGFMVVFDFAKRAACETEHCGINISDLVKIQRDCGKINAKVEFLK